MPVGEGLEVHVFTNSHAELVRSGAYKGLGMEMNALLEKWYPRWRIIRRG